MTGAGRFAPSPTGELHLGNLRTALVAWLSARSNGRGFIVRMEDLDRVTSSQQHELEQLRSLSALGIDWDGEVIRQSERFAIYDDAIATLAAAGRTYECFCTRREIRDAISAPHDSPHDSLAAGDAAAPGLVADGAYPGTCRELSTQQLADFWVQGRRPAVRLRANGVTVSIRDELHGAVHGVVDDVVLRRNDGVPAYNLAVVVDDAAQAVAEVVRGDDLLSSTPRQVLLQQLLGLPTPTYVHVPLVLGADRVRLAKRHGAVTLAQLGALGIDSTATLALLATSLGLGSGKTGQTAVTGETLSARDLIERFDLHTIPREPWVLPANLQRSVP